MGDAFHRFDVDRAIEEIASVLVPRGALAVISSPVPLLSGTYRLPIKHELTWTRRRPD